MVAVLSDVVMPDTVVQAGLRGKNQRRNERARSASGYTQANVLWESTLRRYDLGFVPMLPSQWQTIEGLHEVTEAGAYGFLMRDPKDSTVTHTDGRLSLVSAGVYQLTKRYTSVGSAQYKDRRITRPIASIVIHEAGAPAVGATVDYDTGLVTYAGAATSLTWAGSFYVPVHFESDDLDWDLVRGGPADQRLIMGSAIVLAEVRE